MNKTIVCVCMAVCVNNVIGTYLSFWCSADISHPTFLLSSPYLFHTEVVSASSSHSPPSLPPLRSVLLLLLLLLLPLALAVWLLAAAVVAAPASVALGVVVLSAVLVIAVAVAIAVSAVIAASVVEWAFVLVGAGSAIIELADTYIDVVVDTSRGVCVLLALLLCLLCLLCLLLGAIVDQRLYCYKLRLGLIQGVRDQGFLKQHNRIGDICTGHRNKCQISDKSRSHHWRRSRGRSAMLAYIIRSSSCEGLGLVALMTAQHVWVS